MKTHDVVGTLSALAQDSRLEIYRLLVRRGPEGFNPGELSQRLDIPAPTLSFHLKALQHAGLVHSRREGRFLHYCANLEHMHQLVAFLTENCCSLSDSTCAPDCSPLVTPRQTMRSK